MGAELFHAEGQTHMTKLIGDFRYSGKATKREISKGCPFFIPIYIYIYIHIYIHTYIYTYIYIQQDATLHSLLYLETALHVSGGTSTHHQERIQLYLQHLVVVTPLLPPAAIVEDLGRRWQVEVRV